ncbi:MAG: hypothetical protein FWD87_03945 [Spirochaetaceae bacterium]|nr:hypothetical protein [Spirochaetaceae bacterium]
MKNLIDLILLPTGGCCGTTNNSNGTGDIHDPGERITDWETALKFLKEGNKRYLKDLTIKKDTHTKDRKILKSGQQPFAVVLTCSDSRTAPEIYFDQKLGGIFVIRNAGNIADATTLGSIEFAVGHLKTPLVVVVGHSSCGAVISAYNGGEYSENLQALLNTINPAVKKCKDADEAIHANVDYVVKQIGKNKIVKKMKAKVLGAHYCIESGEVNW